MVEEPDAYLYPRLSPSQNRIDGDLWSLDPMRGETLHGQSRAVLDNPELRSQVFELLRPTD